MNLYASAVAIALVVWASSNLQLSQRDQVLELVVLIGDLVALCLRQGMEIHVLARAKIHLFLPVHQTMWATTLLI